MWMSSRGGTLLNYYLWIICLGIHRRVSRRQQNCVVVAASCCHAASLRVLSCLGLGRPGGLTFVQSVWYFQDSKERLQAVTKRTESSCSVTFWLSDQAVCGCRNASHICMYNILSYNHVYTIIFFCPSLFISFLALLCWIDCDLRQEAGNLKPATCGSLIHYRIKLPAWHQSCSDSWPAFCTATEEGCWLV